MLNLLQISVDLEVWLGVVFRRLDDAEENSMPSGRIMAEYRWENLSQLVSNVVCPPPT